MLASHAKRLLLGLVLAQAGCVFSPGLESGDECEADDDCKARGECVCLEGRCVPAESGGSCTLPDNCGLGETNCDGDCVDLDSDPAHCGACYTTCDPGEDCTGGDCRCGSETACAPGLTCCGGACVDTDTNPVHCGGCGAACDDPPAAACEGDTRVQYPARGECSDGACDYPPSYQDCPGGCAGGVCQGDPCAGRCEPDEICVAGDCYCDDSICQNDNTCAGDHCICAGEGGTCPDGLICCADQCVDAAHSLAHCGQCGNACWPIPEPYCQGGVLVSFGGRAECFDGICNYPDSTEVECPAGCDEMQGRCSGDDACLGITCPGEAQCHDGACSCYGLVCARERMCCDLACIDPLANSDHCGGCYRECVVSDALNLDAAWCDGGFCHRECTSGWLDCDDYGGNGCETDAGGAHDCGQCDRDCADLLGHASDIDCDGGFCYHGGCIADWTSCTPPAAEDGCESHPWIDLDHCGGCGNECVAGQICARGNCVALDADNQRTVDCGPQIQICTGLEQCCRSIDQARCVGRDDAGGCPHGVLLDCDDATDCPEDHVCCLDHMQLVAACTLGGCPVGDARLCATNEDCPDMQSCTTSAVDIGPVAISLGHCQ